MSDNPHEPAPEVQADSLRAAAQDLLSPSQWRRRILFWSGAIIVGLAAVGIARAADAVFGVFTRIVAHNSYWPFPITPTVFALLA